MKKQSSAATASKIDKVNKLIQHQKKELNKARRQLEIEAALERVRALTMVMKHSAELSEIILTVYKELRQLDMALTRILIWLLSENPDMFEVWVADTEADKTSFVMKQEVEHPYHKRMFKKWKERKSKWVYINEGEGKKDLDDYLFTKTAAVAVPEEVKAGIRAVDRIVNTFSFHNFGGIQADGPEELSDEKFEILYRFAKEFDLAYTRFLDLQKAEAQAREAQIEAALERVRSRSIAMRRSEEIADIAAKIFGELRQLDLALNRVLIWTFNETEKYTTWWSSNPEVESTVESYRIDYNDNPVFINYLQAWQQRKPVYLFTLSGDTKKSWEDHLFEHTEMSRLPMAVRKGMRSEGTLYTVSVISDYGLMMSGSFEPLSEVNIDIIQRFGRVFQQSYTRYLDVQKAEAQAREAEIQLALERVRAKTMAIHESDELLDTVTLLFEQFKKVQSGNALEDIDRSFFLIHNEGYGFDLWITEQGGAKSGRKFQIEANEKTHGKLLAKGFKNKQPIVVVDLKPEKSAPWFDYLRAQGVQVSDALYKVRRINTNAYFSRGYLGITSYRPLSDANLKLLERFGAVFEQTYTRFLDLKKAEAQARESQIETGLERVRAQAMAMHRSDDLGLTIKMFYEQMSNLLDTPIIRCGAGLLNREDSMAEIATASKDSKGEIFNVKGNIDMTGHPLLKNTFDHWSDQKEYYHVLKGSEIKKYYEYMTNQVAMPDYSEDEEQHFYFPMFSEGSFYVITKSELNDEELSVVRRFSSVLSLTYRRFNDLKKAEAQAREAEIQLALERVRARTMAMHKSDELSDTASVMFQELKKLGINSIRTGVCIFDFEKDSAELWLATEDGDKTETKVLGKVSGDMHPMYRKWIDTGAQKKKLFQYEMYGKELSNYYRIASARLNLPKQTVYNKSEIYYGFFFSGGSINVIATDPLTEEELDIGSRFANVFGLLYRRFLDLQKAESQAREAQIEAALERVRSRSMGMQKSDELQKIVTVVIKELLELGVVLDAGGGVILCTYIKDSKDFHQWMASPDFSHSGSYLLPYFDHPIMNDSWKFKESGVDFSSKSYSEEVKNSFFKHSFEHSDHKYFHDDLKKWILQTKKYVLSWAWSKNSAILIPSHTGMVPSESEKEILIRFSRVFDQAYTRFLDLQKAEAQAREAQIEAALEKVRSRTIGMQHSDELQDAAVLLFRQVEALGVPVFGCGFNIWDNDRKEATAWMAGKDRLQPPFKTSSSEDIFLRIYKSAQKGKSLFVEEQGGEALITHYEYMNSIPIFKEIADKMATAGQTFPTFQIMHCAFFSQGYLMFITFEPVPEAYDIFERFAKVFEQTYTRFLDLKKAEAQAREAQIEAVLERVRSKTMAMHNSEDVGDTVVTMFDELVKLGIQSNRCGIVIFNESQYSEIWTAKSTDKDKGFLVIGHLDVSIHPLLENVRLAWERKDSFFSYEMEGEYLRGYYEAINSYKKYPTSFNMDQLPERETLSDFFFSEGAIFAFTNEPLKTEATLIFKRFAGVFGQTYRRYLDLKKAESQAREARIEAALERIRAAAMAMHSSEDVSDATSVMFSQLDELGVETIRCGVALFDTETKSMEAWASAKSSNKRILQITGKIDMTIHPLLESLYNAWKSKKPVHRYDLRGDNLRSYYEAITEKSDFNLPSDNLPSKQTANSFFFPEGSLYAFTEKPLEGEYAEIFKRFTKVFTLTYRRYLDLIEAEVRTREAIKQSSLDRVRGEIASMRTAKDLERITPLIWQELVSLDVPFIRCGVFIMDRDNRIIDNYLSTPDGKAIAAFHLPYDTPGFVADVLSHWKKKQIFIEHWNARAMAEFADVLVNQGIFSSPDQYLKTLPKEGFYLHLLPFLQGMLYVGNLEQLSTDAIDLLQSLANAFSTAYARYDDFNKLEIAKKQVDKALVELKQAQQQLIHSEKMASLGELTAGIAHEIQNPLNFVNNFSEVNKELITELEESILQGDYEEVKAIAKDLAGNQEKINHHGKRAEGIVKGMLQHSRSSSGQKELTDINALCDEYLRLAYHGFRAKDKSFNAEYKLNLDPSLPQVNVVPQDIGRVLLNLINNAFQAVSFKVLASEGSDYKPEVVVSLKRLDGSVEIRIADNGSGIPENIKDKIFQPFFTTKPTGQGTGLGLSLSYDIIKAHNGEVKFESDSNSGTMFKIILPSH